MKLLRQPDRLFLKAVKCYVLTVIDESARYEKKTQFVNCASLIRDSDCLQLGIVFVPDAVLVIFKK